MGLFNRPGKRIPPRQPVKPTKPKPRPTTQKPKRGNKPGT